MEFPLFNPFQPSLLLEYGPRHDDESHSAKPKTATFWGMGSNEREKSWIPNTIEPRSALNCL